MTNRIADNLRTFGIPEAVADLMTADDDSPTERLERKRKPKMPGAPDARTVKKEFVPDWAGGKVGEHPGLPAAPPSRTRLR